MNDLKQRCLELVEALTDKGIPAKYVGVGDGKHIVLYVRKEAESVTGFDADDPVYLYGMLSIDKDDPDVWLGSFDVNIRRIEKGRYKPENNEIILNAIRDFISGEFEEFLFTTITKGYVDFYNEGYKGEINSLVASAMFSGSLDSVLGYVDFVRDFPEVELMEIDSKSLEVKEHVPPTPDIIPESNLPS